MIFTRFPQVAEAETPQWWDADGSLYPYPVAMTRVFLADTRPEDRSTIRAMVEELKMKVVGEADNWESLLRQVELAAPDLLLVDWGLINPETGATLAQLRKLCPKDVAIILTSSMGAHEQAAVSAGVDAFISKNDTVNHVTSRIKKAVSSSLQSDPCI